MDLNTKNYQEGQRKAIESTSHKLFISAGAGTGKTFTLTQKIAWMFAEESGASLKQIGDLLAITFTNMAAGELMRRVRSVLRSEGMSEQAMQIDNAWISTIHGMCSRILREYALELGIDPGFQIITEQASDELLSLAFDDAFKQVDGAHMSAILSRYQMRSRGSFNGGPTVVGVVSKIVDVESSAPSDADLLHMGPEAPDPASISDALAQHFGQSLDIYDGQDPNDSWDDASHREAYLLFIEALQAVANADQDMQLASLAHALDLVPYTNKMKKPWKDKECKLRVDIDSQQVVAANAAIDRLELELFARLAELVKASYDERKRLSGYLDNNDLLVKLHSAIRQHPEIRDKYSSQFKLIMVDEFQDTDWLQFDSIAHLLADDAQRCTVGDAQQSIYRFRGADVSLFRRTGAEAGVEKAALDVNFRSHPAILSMVNEVFEKPFGKEFLRLHAPEEYKEKPYPQGMPRVELLMGTYKFGSGVNVSGMVAFEAAAVAKRFSQIRDGYKAMGKTSPKMVVLLDTMTNASVYSDALRANGFDAVITGGSGFWEMPETVAVCDLLRVLSNPLDDEAMIHVLLGPAFGISPDDIASLALPSLSQDKTDDGRRNRKRSLWSGIRKVASAGSEDRANVSESCAFAADVIKAACQAASTQRADDVLTSIFSDSGWAARLSGDAIGRAAAANVLKAIRIVGTIVDDPAYGGCGDCVTTAHAFATMLQSGVSKEAPGALMGDDSSTVAIMTIHASKGLAFPIVAVADFTGIKSPTGFMCEVNSNDRWIGLAMSKSRGGSDMELPDMEGKVFADLLTNCTTNIEYSETLKALIQHENEMEQWRKFYVASTRAQQSLVMSFNECITKSKGRVPSSNISAGLLDGLGLLGQDGTLPAEDSDFLLDGGYPAHLTALSVEVDSSGNLVCQSHLEIAPSHTTEQQQEIVVPIRAELEPQPLREATGNVMSYSKMARMLPKRASEDADADASAAKVVDTLDDSATNLGSAYHRVMEYLIESGAYSGDGSAVEIPDSQRIDRLTSDFALDTDARSRLDAALTNWEKAIAQGLTDGWFDLRPEVPFMTCYGAGQDRWYITGAIDALATDGKGKACILDYKTGYPANDTDEQMHATHELQAMVYADAVFCGQPDVNAVEEVFARVEHLDAQGQMRKTAYNFSREEDAERIHEHISKLKGSI